MGKGPDEEEEEHEDKRAGLVADESSLSQADPELFEFAVVAVLTSDKRGLSDPVITVRAEIESSSPWTETAQPPMLSRGDEEDENNEEEEKGQGDEEAETPCSFSLCSNSSACT